MSQMLPAAGRFNTNKDDGIAVAALKRFAELNGAETECLLVRAGEVVVCAARRGDGKVSLARINEATAAIEFDLREGLPARRVINWDSFAKEKYAAQWQDVIKAALQFYVNSHTGPTGQIEIEIPGASLVLAGEDRVSMQVAALAAMFALTGEWEQIAPEQFEQACIDADLSGEIERVSALAAGAKVL